MNLRFARAMSLGVCLTQAGCIFDFRPWWVRDDDEPDRDRPVDTGTVDSDVAPETDRPETDMPDTTPPDDSDEEPVRPSRGWDVFPSGAALGQTVVASVVSFSGVNASELSTIEIIGPTAVTVGALQVRSESEALVVLTVAQRGRAVPHDVLLTLRDGTGIWLEDAFILVEDPSAAPQDYWDGQVVPPEPADTSPADTQAGEP